jgi:hemerythrin
MNRYRSHEPGSSRPSPAESDLTPRGPESASTPSPGPMDRPAANLLVWRDEWCMGIPSLDADHQEMVRLVNQLLSTRHRPSSGRVSDLGKSCPAAAGPPGAQPLVRFEALLDHLREHFRREEALMLSIDYDEFQVHQCEHSLQLAELAELGRQLPRDGSHGFTQESLNWIKRWCFDHLISEDRRLAEAYQRASQPDRRMPTPSQ